MRRRAFFVGPWLALGLCAGALTHSDTAPAEIGAPATDGVAPTHIGLFPDGRRIIASTRTPGLLVMAPNGESIEATYPVPAVPTGLLVLDAHRFLVTTGQPFPGVHLFAEGNPVPAASRMLAGRAGSPVRGLTPDTVLLLDQENSRLLELSLPNLEPLRALDLPKSAHALVAAPAAGVLLIGHRIPEQDVRSAPRLASLLTVVDAGLWAVRSQIELPDGSTGLDCLTLSPDGQTVYASHLVGRYRLPVTQLERGWMMTNAITALDLASGEARTFLLDNVLRGWANPRGLACSPDGKTLAVALSGSDALLLIDRAALHRRLKEKRPPDLSPENDLTLLDGIHQVVDLPGFGPRVVVAEGDHFVVSGYDNDSIITVSADGEKGSVRKLSHAPPDAIRRGERLFFTATNCYQQWLSCASCHADARHDGLKWDLVHDGLGNPAPTADLVVRIRARAEEKGIDSAKEGLLKAYHVEQFANPDEQDLADLLAYLLSLSSP